MHHRRMRQTALPSTLCAIAATFSSIAAAPPTSSPPTSAPPASEPAAAPASAPTSEPPASTEPASPPATTEAGAPTTATADEHVPGEAGAVTSAPAGVDATTGVPETTVAPACPPPDAGSDEPPTIEASDAAALFVASIALVETGYDFGADRGGVSGAYLLSDADWAGHGGYRRAAAAPPEAQTARAEELAGALLASGISSTELAALWLHANSVSATGGHGGPVAAYVDEVATQAGELVAAGADAPAAPAPPASATATTSPVVSASSTPAQCPPPAAAVDRSVGEPHDVEAER